MTENSCKDCPDRFPGCHSSCERYEAWKKKRQEINENRINDIKYSYRHGRTYETRWVYRLHKVSKTLDRKRGRWIYDK